MPGTRPEPVLHTPAAVPDAISVVAALAWVTLLVCYLAQGAASALADFRNKTFSPFISLAPITGMLLALTLSAYAFTAGQALVVVFLVGTLLFGGLLTGEWIVAELDHDSAHPGYFLPTVAGGLVGSFCAAGVHLHGLAAASFGVGLLSWLLVGSTILNRLFFHAALPPELMPTLAIELAPPAVAGIAYFALTGGRTDMLGPGAGRLHRADGAGPGPAAAPVPRAAVLPRLLGVHLLLGRRRHRRAGAGSRCAGRRARRPGPR